MSINQNKGVGASSRSSQQIFLLWVGMLGALLFNIVYFSFGVIAPHYNIMQQPISDLALLHDGWVQSVNFILFGLSVCAFAFALHAELRSGFGSVLLPLLHWITGLGLILAGLIIQQPAHNWILLISFIPVLISFLLFAIRFRAERHWKGWTIYSIFSAVLMLVLVARFIYCLNTGAQYAGIYERLAVVTRLAWVVLFTIKLLDGRRLLR
jgi:hypothetical protein